MPSYSFGYVVCPRPSYILKPDSCYTYWTLRIVKRLKYIRSSETLFYSVIAATPTARVFQAV